MEERHIVGVYDSKIEADLKLDGLLPVVGQRNNFAILSAGEAATRAFAPSHSPSAFMRAGARTGLIWGIVLGILPGLIAVVQDVDASLTPMRLAILFLVGVLSCGIAGFILGGLASWTAARKLLKGNRLPFAHKVLLTFLGDRGEAERIRAVLSQQAIFNQTSPSGDLMHTTTKASPRAS